ncbi:hypothetical protein H0H87_000794 [Tephrocybe sp. NHM501043]|nr:hypothetical protein H0H87_000794 [Tephrocybe sp. NHM501043]
MDVAPPVIPSPPNFADFQFSVIGQAPRLLRRIASPPPDFEYQPSPTPSEMDLQYPSSSGTPFLTPATQPQPSLEQRLQSTAFSTSISEDPYTDPMDLTNDLEQKPIIDIQKPLPPIQSYMDESKCTNITGKTEFLTAQLPTQLRSALNDNVSSFGLPASSSVATPVAHHLAISSPSSQPPQTNILTLNPSSPSKDSSETHTIPIPQIHSAWALPYESALIAFEKAKQNLIIAQETYDAAKASLTAITLAKDSFTRSLAAHLFYHQKCESRGPNAPSTSTLSQDHEMTSPTDHHPFRLQKTLPTSQHLPIPPTADLPTSQNRRDPMWAEGQAQRRRMLELEQEADDVRRAWGFLERSETPDLGRRSDTSVPPSCSLSIQSSLSASPNTPAELQSADPSHLTNHDDDKSVIAIGAQRSIDPKQIPASAINQVPVTPLTHTHPNLSHSTTPPASRSSGLVTATHIALPSQAPDTFDPSTDAKVVQTPINNEPSGRQAPNGTPLPSIRVSSTLLLKQEDMPDHELLVRQESDDLSDVQLNHEKVEQIKVERLEVEKLQAEKLQVERELEKGGCIALGPPMKSSPTLRPDQPHVADTDGKQSFQSDEKWRSRREEEDQVLGEENFFHPVDASSFALQEPGSQNYQSAHAPLSPFQAESPPPGVGSLFQRLQQSPSPQLESLQPPRNPLTTTLLSSPRQRSPCQPPATSSSMTTPRSSMISSDASLFTPHHTLGKRRQYERPSVSSSMALPPPKRRNINHNATDDFPDISLESRLSDGPLHQIKHNRPFVSRGSHHASGYATRGSPLTSGYAYRGNYHNSSYKSSFVPRDRSYNQSERLTTPPSGPRDARKDGFYDAGGYKPLQDMDSQYVQSSTSALDRPLGDGPTHYGKFERHRNLSWKNPQQKGATFSSGFDRQSGVGRGGKHLGHHRLNTPRPDWDRNAEDDAERRSPESKNLLDRMA